MKTKMTAATISWSKSAGRRAGTTDAQPLPVHRARSYGDPPGSDDGRSNDQLAHATTSRTHADCITTTTLRPGRLDMASTSCQLSILMIAAIRSQKPPPPIRMIRRDLGR